MLHAILAGTALVGVCSTAHAGELLATIEHAVEVPLRAFELPTVATGIVELTACNACETRSTAASRDTEYLVNGRAATFEAFAAAVRAARAAPAVANRSLVGLYFDAASKRLVRIALVAPLR